MIYLVDCNNFFVSCERLFNPAIAHRPVIVLSANDGCTIARSQEVKNLGIPMGIPPFKIKELVKQHNIALFSSNFILYREISSRLMRRLCDLAPSVEVYSVDEAFLHIDHLSDATAHQAHAQQLRSLIKRELGIPVSIGIAPTKTLAKLAGEQANQHGIGLLTGTHADDQLLQQTSLQEIWGVGSKTARFLESYRIRNACDLKYTDTKWLRKQLGVGGVRTQLELQGHPCIQHTDSIQQQLIYSRSFGERITSRQILHAATATFVSSAARKLRKRNLAARAITVYVTTGRHAATYYSNSRTQVLSAATQYTPMLTHAAQQLLNEIYQEGYAYKKVGIILSDLVDQESQQCSLFEASAPERTQQDLLMQALDSITRKHGTHTVFYGNTTVTQDWLPHSTLRSQNFLGSWSDLPKAYAK